MKIAILGAGSFATAIAQNIEKEHDVLLFTRNKKVIWTINKKHVNERYYPSIKLNKNICSEKLDNLLKYPRIDIIIFALPSRIILELIKNKQNIEFMKNKTIIIACKGIAKDGRTISSILIKKGISKEKIIIFSGPTFADELIRKNIAGMTIGSLKKQNYNLISDLFEKNMWFDYIRNLDGVQIAGAIKNIYAISLGLFDSFFPGNNSHYFFLNETYKEMKRILDLFDKELHEKYCAFGDLNLTGNIDLSRNRTIGLMLGKGFIALKTMKKRIVLEGVSSIDGIEKLAKKNKIKTPILDFVKKTMKKDKITKKDFYELLKKIRNEYV